MSNNQRSTARNRFQTTLDASVSLTSRNPHPLATVTFPPSSPPSEPSSPEEEGSGTNSTQGTTSSRNMPSTRDSHSDTLTFTPYGLIRTPPHLQAARFGRRAATLGQPYQPVSTASASALEPSNQVFSDVPDEELYPASKRQKRSHVQTKDVPETAPSYVENSCKVVEERRNAIAGQNGSGTPDVRQRRYSRSEMSVPPCCDCGGDSNLCLGQCIR